MKVSLFLMSKKGLDVLSELCKMDYARLIDKVIIGKDKAVLNDYSAQLKKLCVRNEIDFHFRNENINIKSDYCIAVSWRWFINTDSNLIVLHDSILPKYRGFAPLVNALKNNEKYIGVTALFATDEYDKGEIILQQKIKVQYPIKINDAINKISVLYKNMVTELFRKIERNENLESYSQNENDATYSLWLEDSDYFIDWKWSSHRIERFVNAVGYPYSGAKTRMGSDIITILSASIIDDVKIENRDVGKIIFIKDGYPVIVCGKGLLKITEAVYLNDAKSIFPLKKFRIRLR